MDAALFFGQLSLGLPLCLGAIGSALGIAAAGRAAAGAWGKAAKEGRPISFVYIILAGMPLSQTIYAFIFTFVSLKTVVFNASAVETFGVALFSLGLACGIAELASAWLQGIVGAAACRALSEGDNKGLVQMIITMGIVETVGLLGFVFLMMMVPVVA